MQFRFLTILSLAALPARAQIEMPRYEPQRHATGVVRVWGQRNASKLVAMWASEFQKLQPEIRVEATMRGNASAIGGLYTRAADAAFLGREIWPTEADAYQQVFDHKHSAVPVATDSYALALYVHKSNPLGKLTFTQLDGVFGADHRRGEKNLRTWGDLGLTGERAKRPIHLYSFGAVRDYSYFFSEAVMMGSRKWNCELREFASGREIVEALLNDPDGLALAGLADVTKGVRVLALSDRSDGAYFAPGAETIARRQYPLSRAVSMYFNQPMEDATREFLRYVLSREGQAEVHRDGSFLPLHADAAAKIRSELR